MGKRAVGSSVANTMPVKEQLVILYTSLAIRRGSRDAHMLSSLPLYVEGMSVMEKEVDRKPAFFFNRVNSNEGLSM